jgi:8-oxo-dGTP diphosphatase
VNREFKFCPYCTTPLSKNEKGYLACSACPFIHWDNPIPVVAVVIPMDHWFLGIANIETEGIPDGGIVLVRRGIPPFVGEWCLPCGHLERHGHPKAEAVREVEEESGLVVRLEKILCNCNPMPGELNQITLSYLGRPVGGKLKAGDDASEVGVFAKDNLPKICFRSHRMLVDRWFAGELGKLTGQDLLI